jgi:deoxyribonucleoside regulator
MTKTTISEERLQLLAEVAHMYYEQGLDQNAIAAYFQLSRASVSRLLSEAREHKVVEFRINFPTSRSSELEETLLDTFALEEVYVLNTSKIAESHILRRLGQLASTYVLSRITDNQIIGLTWGTTLYETIVAMPRYQTNDTEVVQVIGALGTKNQLHDGPEIARQFAEKLGAQHHYLHSPLIVESRSVRDAMLKNHSVNKTIELARQAQLLVTGIGTIDPDYSAPLRAGYITAADIDALKHAGAVGEFCSYHIDANGNPLQTSINDRIVGMTIEDIRAIPHVVGIAAGEVKAQSALAVIKSGLVKAVVIDDKLATRILDQY